MTNVLLHIIVEDFDKWKPLFDRNASARIAAGSMSYQLYRAGDNPNQLFIIFDWDTVENARAFFSSEDLRQKMQEAGVISQPQVFFLDEVETRREQEAA